MTQYLYRVDARKNYVGIEIGIFDPERWNGEGGIAFGRNAMVYLSDAWDFEGNKLAFKVEVSQGSMGSCDIETAQQRADVHQQAIDMALFMQDSLDNGETPEDIGRWFKLNLREDPALPADSPFRYGK